MTEVTPVRPKGTLNQRPVVVEGTTYDPFKPPKMMENTVGSTYWAGGMPLETNSQMVELKAQLQALIETAGLSTSEVIQMLEELIHELK